MVVEIEVAAPIIHLIMSLSSFRPSGPRTGCFVSDPSLLSVVLDETKADALSTALSGAWD